MARPQFQRARGPEDRVCRVTREVEAVFRPGVADGVLPPIAVGLIEQVDLAAQHDGSRRTNAVPLHFPRVLQLTDLLPVEKVVAGGNADIPALGRLVLVVRQGIVEPVASLELHDRRVLGKGLPGHGVSEVHAGLLGGGQTGPLGIRDADLRRPDGHRMGILGVVDGRQLVESPLERLSFQPAVVA